MKIKNLHSLINKILYDEDYSKDLVNYALIIISVLFSDIITQEQCQSFILYNQPNKSILLNENSVKKIIKIKKVINIKLRRLFRAKNHIRLNKLKNIFYNIIFIKK